MMKNKSYSESETDLLTASTDTLATKKDFPMEVRQDARRFAKFVWNPEENEVMGRTETDWARLMFFYFCFMSALGAYTAVALSIYLEVRYVQSSLTLCNVNGWYKTRGATNTNPTNPYPNPSPAVPSPAFCPVHCSTNRH